MALTLQEIEQELARRGVSDPSGRVSPGGVATRSPRGYTREDIEAEIRRRGLPVPGQMQPIDEQRQQIYQEMAQDVGPMQAFLIGTGRGFADVARGVGIMDPAPPEEAGAMQALRQENPVSTMAGEITGQTAPFLPLGGVVGGGLRTTAAGGRTILPAARTAMQRTVAGATLGGAEGATIARGMDEDMTTQGLAGAGFGAGAELMFPIIGRAGKRLFERVFRRTPQGPMLDVSGRPTEEFQAALDASGMSFDQLSEDAAQAVREMRPGTVPEQAARAARFQTEEVPATLGEITGQQAQLTTEQRLLGSTQDQAAEPFRQFKLQQSEAIKDSLNRAVGEDFTKEDAGILMKDALEGRQSLMRTQKNDLYRLAQSKAEDLGGLPLFVDDLAEAIPDEKTLRRIARREGKKVSDFEDLLVEFGVSDSPEAVENFVQAGGRVEPLTLENVEDFRQELNAIIRNDTSGRMSVIAGPVLRALDNELVNMADSTGALVQRIGAPNGKVQPIGGGVSAQTIDDIKGLRKTLEDARAATRKLKTEFDPGELVGKLTRPRRRGGATPMVEASKAYDTIMSKAQPVEQVRKVVESLSKADQAGKDALSALQATTMLDLIESGFSTESRKIDGVKLFNPTAFKRRLKNIGMDKVEAVFKGNPKALRKIKNIDKIAADLIPPDRAVPKGTSDNLLDVLSALGLMSIVGRVPGVGTVATGAAGMAGEAAQRAKTRRSVREALNATPEVQEVIDRSFPAIRSALEATPATAAAPVGLEQMRGDGDGSEQNGYGKRADGTMKGKGFLGPMRNKDGGISTEVSIGIDFGMGEMEIPLMVPTLNKTELNQVLSGEKPSESIVKKAVDHAKMRIDNGKSPFAD